MEAVLANLASALKGREGGSPLLVGTGKDHVHLLVVCTGERGLCGGFNSAIARLAREHANRLLADGKTVKILCVGRKGYDQLKRNYAPQIIDTIEFRGVRQLTFEHAEKVAEKVLALFDDGEFDVATLFFSRFRSVISQVPTAQQIIPANLRRGPGAKAAARRRGLRIRARRGRDPERAAAAQHRRADLRALLENAASFYGAQMSAMDNATRNAGDMIDRLTLSYNRPRQAQITKELIEIISGAEAV